MQPVFDAVQVIVCNIIELFAPAVGSVRVHIYIERMTLPAYKRRALVLILCELLLASLQHGLAGHHSGNITVTLGRTESKGMAQLSVGDDGWGISGDWLPPRRGSISDLAALLESDVTYYLRKGGGTEGQVRFPVTALA